MNPAREELQPARDQMVQEQLVARGIKDPLVLGAFQHVAREAFVPPELSEFAYRDAPLPISEGQTISQPYIVAITTEALALKRDERVLEIGTGSGYAAAILASIAKEVFSVERRANLAKVARERLRQLNFFNVHVKQGDGTLGWKEHAPFDAIAVAAGGPVIPKALLSQLKVGGRLVIPIGPDESSQVLVRVTQVSPGEFRTEELMDVRFVPLIGEQGWPIREEPLGAAPTTSHVGGIERVVREACEPFASIEDARISALIDRISDARLVLMGESTHGTREFYRMRARITQELIERRGFNFVAVEADWPDAARIDDHVLGDESRSKPMITPFTRFPTWMWRNREVDDFVGWLRERNLKKRERSHRVGFHGLDMYCMFTSISVVLAYLDEIDPNAAQVARARYGLLTPWQRDPAGYGEAVLTGRYSSAETHVVAILRSLLAQRLEYAQKDGERFFDAAQNARVVANAEGYYRALYYGSATAWNRRDTHMFDTLQALLSFYGKESRGIVWGHNSHVSNAAATEMSSRGEINIGELCRLSYGDRVYSIGFGTDHGTVTAASNWGASTQKMQLRPSHAQSYERVFHDSKVPAFMLHLREPKRAEVRAELLPHRLERAIGLIYRPDHELGSHYFQACLPRQFDEYVWFNETQAVEPLPIGLSRF